MRITDPEAFHRLSDKDLEEQMTIAVKLAKPAEATALVKLVKTVRLMCHATSSGTQQREKENIRANLIGKK